ncbi:MAG: T9SS type A sorting domain-containing protein [Chitinophagaceae bacterium]|nr:MAG: T9SS type A sorting domain-containing protein [Chitinophagaceae bacterium]
MSQQTALAGAQLRAAQPAFTPAGTVRNLSARFGRRLLGLIGFLAFGSLLQAQTTHISATGDGGFETGSTFAANGWTVVNDATNTWQVGSVATPFAGARNAFVSNNGGTTWAYTLTTTQTSHFYRDITVPAGETKITLTFQWKGSGESGFDRLLVYTAPTSVTPVLGVPASSSTSLTGATLQFSQPSFAQAAYTTATVTLPASLAGTTFRLIFTWQNDNSTGPSPGAAVDNISLTSAAPATITSNGAGGNWSSTATWIGGVVPTVGDNVIIADGSTVTIDAGNPSINNLTIGGGTSGNVVYSTTAAQTLTVAGDLTINSGGSLKTAATGTVTTHALSLAGNVTNNGTLDMSTSTNNAGGTITFTGSTSAAWTNGASSVTNLRTASVTLNKGTSSSTVLTFTPGGTFSVQGTSTLAFLTITNGQFALAGSGAFSNPVFATAGYTIPSTGGFWLNNANATITGQSGSPTLAGLLRISNGIFTIGTTNNSMGFSSGAVINIEGGIVNAVARFGVSTSSNNITYTQSGGTVYTNTAAGNASSTLASFDAGTSSSTVFTMSGGTIVIAKGSANTEYRGPSTSATLNITGGTLQLGTAVVASPAITITPGSTTFRITSVTPSIVLNSNNNPGVSQAATVTVYGDLTLNGSGTYTNNSSSLTLRGNSASNPGNIVVNGSTFTINTSNTQTLSFTSSFGNQALTNNAGTIASSTLPSITINNTAASGTVTIPTNLTIMSGSTLTLTAGTLTVGGAGVITFGTNATAMSVIRNAGSLSATTVTYFTGMAPNVSYTGAGATSTGVELSTGGATILTALTVNGTGAVVTLNRSVSASLLALTSGKFVTTSSNLITVTGTTTGSITGASTSNYVQGPLARTLPLSLATGSTYTFPVGKTGYNPFELVNPTTNSGGTVTIRAEAFDGSAGGTAGAAFSSIATNRYWQVQVNAGGTNFTSTLVKLNDTRGTNNGIASSATQAGAYNLVGGASATLATTSITTVAPAVTSPGGFYLMGLLAPPTLSNLGTTPSGNRCTNVARTVSVTATPAGSAISTVILTYTVNGGGAQNVSMSNGGSGNVYTGTIPTVTPATATVAWSITVTDANGLTATQAGTSYADEPLLGYAGTISGTTPVCQNSSTPLTAVVAKPATLQVGTSSTSSSTTSNLGVPYPTYYGNGRQQYLVLASELQALGLAAGNITSLAFDVVTPGTTNNLNGYTIKIGTTAVTTLTSFQSPTFTTVFGPSNITPVTGVNTHTFTTPFVWDGTSNIIVDICFSNGNSGTAAKQNVVRQTSTAFASTVVYQFDGSTSTACTSTTLSTSGSVRPNMVFGGSIQASGLTYSWSDGSSTLGSGNPFSVSPQSNTTYTFTATDANGCSVTSSSKTITVTPAPSAPTATNSTQCGQGTPIALVTSTSGLGSPVFRWYAAQTGGSSLQSSTSTTYGSSINTTTSFWVSEFNSATGCESVRTEVIASVNAPDAVSASSNGPVCLGTAVALTATKSGSTNTYVYTWTAAPAAGSGIPASTSGETVNVVPTVTGTYTYTVVANEASSGCTTSSTVNVTVNGNPVITSVTANPTAVCPGGNVALSATNTVAGTGTIGTAGTTTSLNGITPFNQVWETAHSQYLVKASDLQAAGLAAGNLTSVAFNVSSGSSTLPFDGYTMKVAHTSAASLSGLLSPTFTTVYGPASFPAVTTSGLKTITFSTPFAWDGTSNILVDVCFSNDPNSNITDNYTGNSTVRATAKSYTASYGYYQDNGTLCGTTGLTSNSSVNLPDMVFAGQVAGPAVSWTWTPGNLSGANVTAVAPNTTGIATYTAKATFAATGCYVTSTVDVNVGANLTVAANAGSNVICVGGSSTLTATPTGGGAPYTYSWSDGVATVGSSASISVSPSQTTTYTVTVTDFCGTIATQSVAVTVNALPTVSITPNTATTVCAASQTFAASTNAATPAYQWLLAASNISGATAASYSAAATGSYSLKVTDGVTGCQNTSSATTLTFQLFPSATSVTPASAASLCLGSAQTLTASATVPTIILNENFNGAVTGWTTSSASTVNTVNWYLQSAPYTDAAGSATFQNFSVDGTTFAYANSDAGGSESITDTKLVSPAFSTVNYTSAALTFQHVFRKYADDVSVTVQYSTNGSTWTTLKTYTTDQGTVTSNAQVATLESITLPAGALNQPNLRIRFNYNSVWGYFWIVDNVKVTAATTIQYAWASSTGSGLTAGQQSASASNSSISVTPTAAGPYTYTVTASISGSSCTSSNTVSLTVVTPSVAPSILNSSATGTVCPGTNVILTQTGGSLGQGAYWQWYSDAGFTQAIGGQLSSANAQLTVSPSATTSYYLRAEGGVAPCPANFAAASPVTVTVYAASVSGTLASAQSLCSGATPAALTLTGSNGSIQWQSATDAAFTQNIVNYGSNASTLTGAEIGALSASTYVRAIVTNGTGCASATSNSILLTVNNYPATFNVLGTATYCDGNGSTVTLSGSQSGVSYQLKKNGSDQGSPVTGTGAAISFGVQPAGTYTVAATNTSGCSIDMSGSAVLSAVGPFSAQISAQNSILCSAGNFTTIYITNGPANGSVTVTTNGGNAQTYSLNGSGSYLFQTGVLNANSTYAITSVGNGSCTTVTNIATTVYVGALVADALPGQSVCPGATVAPITFLGNFPAGTTYSWTSTNTAIGLAQASGSGTSLPSFTATNGGSSIIYSDISVVPNLAIEGCEVRAMVFRISVKPTPTMNSVGSQSVCAGAQTTPVTFSGNMAGTTYLWSNSNPAIGMAAQGAGNIGAFTATNNTAQSSISGTFTVTPFSNGCGGTPSTFTITVNKAAATIGYSGSPYCPTGVGTPQIAGTRGGTFSAAAGVVFYSTTTGEINLGGSQAGTYTITYTVNGVGGGCGGTSTASITILPRATVNIIGNQALCAGGTTNMVQPTGTAAGFTWVNLNPSIGLPASGTGAIPAFTAINNTSGIVTAQINVTPVGDGSSNCAGNPVAYRYTIYPRPTVNPVNNGDPYIYCRTTLSTPVTFTSATPNTTYTWTNDNTTIGLANRGTGGVPSFTAANPLVGATNTATITVTPSATKCAGTPYQFVINVADCITQAGGNSGDGNTARMAAQVVVGPNPTSNRVTVYYKGTDAGPFTVQLVSQFGQSIIKPATFSGTSHTLDLTGLTPGVYVLQLVNPRTKETVQKQVIKL